MLRFLLLLLPFLTLSCKEEAPQSLTWEERAMADSLFQVEINILKPQLDSICEIHFDSLKNYYVDSLWTDRLQEIKKQLERIQLQ